MGLLRLQVGPNRDIGGSILAVDLNKGVYREFNSHVPHPRDLHPLIDVANIFSPPCAASANRTPAQSAVRLLFLSNRLPGTLCPGDSGRVTERVTAYERLDQQEKGPRKETGTAEK